MCIVYMPGAAKIKTHARHCPFPKASTCLTALLYCLNT
jgi:hypothetical protein